MKKIEEFCKTLGDDALKNIELILNEIDKNIKNIKNIEYTYYLSNLLINECIKENVTNKEKYINLATFHRNKFVEYLAQKLNICYGNRDWEGVLHYANKGLEVLKTPKYIDDLKIYEFSNFEDAFFYTHLNPQEKFRWVQTKDSLFLFKKAMAYKMLGDYEQSLKFFYECQEYDPMSFAIHYEIIDLFYKQDNMEKMFNAVRKAHEFAYTHVHIATLLVFQSHYFLSKQNYIAAKACLAMSLNYDNSVKNANSVENVVYIIKEQDTSDEPFENLDAVKQVLKSNFAMYTVRRHMIEIACALYSQFLKDKNTSAHKKIEMRKILLKIADKNIVEIVEYEINKKLKLIIDNEHQIRFEIPNQFSILPKGEYNNLNLVSDMFFCATNKDTTIEIGYLNNSENKPFIDAINCFVESLKNPAIKIENLGETTFISGKTVIKYKLVFEDEDFVIVAYFTTLPQNRIGIFQINCNTENVQDNTIILNRIINSVKQIN